MEDDPGSITQWLRKLQDGESDAADAIWKRYYPKLVRAASKYLSVNPDSATDGEDVAQSTFRNVFMGIVGGKYPDIDGREGLWKLLLVSTINRVRRHHRDSNAQKRPRYSSRPLHTLDASLLTDLNSPQVETELADLVETLVRILDDEDPTGELRQIALLQLDGFSANEIARTIKRRKTIVLQKIRLIRILWKKRLSAEAT